MGSRTLEANLARLVEHGRAPATPAAWIGSTTRPEERVVVGTLADLAERVAAERHEGPAIVVVGEVVAFRARLLALAREEAAA
jgi:siroheme synthase